MDGGIMNKIYIAKLNEEKAEVLEGKIMAAPYNGKQMVKIFDTGLVYYEKIENIANTKLEAITILRNRLNNLSNQVKELWNKNELR